MKGTETHTASEYNKTYRNRQHTTKRTRQTVTKTRDMYTQTKI